MSTSSVLSSFRPNISVTVSVSQCSQCHGGQVDKISSRIFVTLRYRDKDPIVEKPGAVIIANYASVTIISNQRKTCTY